MNNAQWDIRSWLLAFGGGNLCGLIIVSLQKPFMRRLITDAPPLNIYGARISVGTILTASLAIISFIILPMVLSATARRLYLLWGLIPVTLVCFWIIIRDMMHDRSEEISNGLWAWVILLAGNVLLICGPISLYRYAKRRKAEWVAAQYQAIQDAARVTQEGVWPPPPPHGTSLTE